MKRGIEESNECETTMNLNLVPTVSQIHYHQHLQQQQQQQINGNNSSSSPISNSTSSYSSSSSSSSSSSYSPLQSNQSQQPTITTIYVPSSSASSQSSNNNSVILAIPTQPGQQSQQGQINNLVAVCANTTGTANQNASNTTGTVSASNSNSTVVSAPVSLDGTTANLASIYSYNNLNSSGSITTKPEPKKVKTQKTQPSKVVHIRNIPQQITEIEIIQFGLIFGNIANVLNLRSKCQAFLEFEKCEEAQSMINYFSNNPISVAGRQIFVQYSNYKNLVTDPSNTNNQVAKAALDMAKELHKAAQSGGQNTVLRAMIQNMLYGVTLDTIYQIFNRFGPVLKIITFTKNDKFQALIQMKDAASAQAAKNGLHGQNIYNSCCTLHIDYSKLNTLNVKYNNEKSRDYTNPLLPAGDCPDHLALGPGGVINAPIQLTMAAAAAAAGYSTPFTTTLPAGYHLATTTNPFLHFTGKYLPQQTLISASTLLQPTQAAQNLASLAAGPSSASTTHQAAAAAAVAAAYGLNQHTVAQTNGATNGISSANPNTNTTNVTSTQNGVVGAPPTGANLTSHNHHPHTHPHAHPSAPGPMLIPFLQNLNDDAYIMMYTT